MRTIGIRVTPSAVNFAIFDSDEQGIVNVEQIKVPAALSTPEALKFVRSNILDILREYDIAKAGIRVTEPNSQTKNIERIQIEGVIQETFASSQLNTYFAGPISTISAKLKIQRENFKKYVDGEMNYDTVENWGDLNHDEREAVLAAIGAVNA